MLAAGARWATVSPLAQIVRATSRAAVDPVEPQQVRAWVAEPVRYADRQLELLVTEPEVATPSRTSS